MKLKAPGGRLKYFLLGFDKRTFDSMMLFIKHREHPTGSFSIRSKHPKAD